MKDQPVVRKAIRQTRKLVWNLRWKTFNRLAKKYECYICHSTFDRFFPYHGGLADFSLFVQQMQLIGSDVENFGCPFCLSNDRERHLFLYFDRLKLWDEMKARSILHFAAERNLSERISGCAPKQYVKADLFPRAADVQKIDILDIPFTPDTFDFVICNHVLEHVADADRALREIHRVLRPGGRAVLQTPFSTLLHRTFEDDGIKTKELRLDVYGQDDHVRLFGRDFFDRIQAAGLRLETCRHEEVATIDEARKYGMNSREDLILVRK